MKRKWIRPSKYEVRGLILIILILILGGCSFPQIGKGPELAVQPEATETPIPTIKSSPTLKPPPTETLVPTPLMSPTKRATWTPLPSRTLRPTWTASPTLSPTATSEVGPILKEDFSDITAPWLQEEAENWATGIARQAYFMTVSQPNVEITSSRSWLKLADVRIQADVYRQTGQGYFGFSCRETSAGNYYTIFVTNDGHYGFGEHRSGRVEFLYYGYSKAIPTGRDEVFKLRGECRGNALSLYVNDVLIDRRTVEGIGSGLTGMMVGMTTEDESPIVVFFDNLEIWGPIE